MSLLNPLLLQIAIGAGGLLLGVVVGTLMAGKRLRGTRSRADQQASDLEGQIAVKRLRIRELESKLADARTPAAPIDQLPASYQQVLPPQPTHGRWLSDPTDSPSDVTPPRN